jgi:hypothetical protein
MDQGQENQKANSTEQDSLNWKDWVKEMDSEGTKYDCSAAALTDDDFAVPTDVKFQDIGEMMKGFMQMGQQLEQNGNPGTVPPTPPVNSTVPMPQ